MMRTEGEKKGKGKRRETKRKKEENIGIKIVFCCCCFFFQVRAHVFSYAQRSFFKYIKKTLSRFSEHRRPSSSSSEVSRHIHQDCPGHAVSMDSVKILDRGPSWFQRGVKEAIYIRSHKPELNRDGGRFILPHIWDNSLTSLKPSGSSGVTVNPKQQ